MIEQQVDTAMRPVSGEEQVAVLEQVVVQGDLSRLQPEERVRYYRAVCESLGLNPLTRPFQYISLQGRLTLYPARDATDQLRRLRGINITGLERATDAEAGIHTVIANGVDRQGRSDSAMGAVSIKGLAGEGLANAYMKAETKAKRRLTLSLAGLGMFDESEIESIAEARPVAVDDQGNILDPQAAAPQPSGAVARLRAALAPPVVAEEPTPDEPAVQAEGQAPADAESMTYNPTHAKVELSRGEEARVELVDPRAGITEEQRAEAELQASKPKRTRKPKQEEPVQEDLFAAGMAAEEERIRATAGRVAEAAQAPSGQSWVGTVAAPFRLAEAGEGKVRFNIALPAGASGVPGGKAQVVIDYEQVPDGLNEGHEVEVIGELEMVAWTDEEGNPKPPYRRIHAVELRA